MTRRYQVSTVNSTDKTGWAPDRVRFARQAHAQAHAILALRDAHTRLLHLRTVDQALEDIRQDIAYRAGRLGRDPDVICDELERARLEQLTAVMRGTHAALEGAA